MSSEEMGMGPSHSHSHSHSNHLLFQDEALPLRFNCAAPQRPKTTRELTGFIDDKLFFTPPHGPQFRRTHWNDDGGAATPSADDSDDEDDVDEDDDEVDDVEVERLVNGVGVGVGVDDSNNNHDDTNTGNKIDRNSNATADNGGTDRVGNGKAKHHHSTFGSSSSREVLVGKDGNVGQSLNHATSDSHNHHHHHHHQHQQQQARLRVGGYQNAVTIAEPDGDLYYSQYLDGSSGLAASGSGHKDVVAVVDNGCGFSGRKDVSVSSESGELRAILSDPVTGALMDDAMILPCGHSFGGGGIQHVTRVKSCYTCSQSISEDSIAPNLSLRAAVQAFRREEELLLYRSSKRRRERFDQDKGGFGDSALMDPSRGRGVQFPFAVTDRVIIKGNKRTPQRFVGREAIVTTQCLNGWYVVKTLDNAESVKLQYRSLAKVSDDPSMKPMPSKIAPNWL